MNFLIRFCIICLVCFQAIAAEECVEKRYIFDIGSGSTKSKGYVVDKCKNQIISQFEDIRKRVGYMECISSSKDKKTITESCLQQGVAAIKSIKNIYGIDCKKEKCKGMATAWARKADNSSALFNLFKTEGVEVDVVSQQEEGTLGFNAVKNDSAIKNIAENNLITWDIGSGSFQLTTLDKKGSVHVYNGPYGNSNFLRKIQEQKLLKTTDGFTGKRYFNKDELDIILPVAFKEVSGNLLRDQLITEKLGQKDIRVIGIGKLMHNTIKVELEMGVTVNKNAIKEMIYLLAGMSLEEAKKKFPKLIDNYPPGGDYVDVAQKSLMVVWVVMESNNIEQIDNILGSGDVADGFAVDAKYWR